MNRSKFVFTTPIAFGLAFLLSSAAVFFGRDVGTPFIGWARLTDGSVRAVYGVPHNIVVDSHILAKFDAASFSDEAGLVLSGTRIQLVDRRLNILAQYEGGDGNAVLNVDGTRDSALAWLPGTHSILLWDGSGFSKLAVNGIGEALVVTAIRKRSVTTAEMLLKDAQGSAFEATVSLESGTLLSLGAVAGVHGAAFWALDKILFDGPTGLSIRLADGFVRNLLPKAGDLTFERISSQWIVITSRSSRQSWALHQQTMQVSEMPIPALSSQEAVR